jgi:hypothetical protein
VSSYFLSARLGGGDPNVILISLGSMTSMRHHFRILEIALLFHTIQNKSDKKYSCYDEAYMYLTVKNLN